MAATTYRFDDAELDATHRTLTIGGRVTHIGARAFDLLLALIERRDRVVSKSELLDVVWPRLVVEENNLQVHVSSLRRLLGAEVISTIPGRGYRFTGTLDDDSLRSTLGDHAPEVRRGQGVQRRSFEPVTVLPNRGLSANALIKDARRESTEAPLANLPFRTAPLYGRASELAAVVSLLGSHAVVSIVGPGGIGKTRLALAAATTAHDRYADGVWWIELAAVQHAGLLAPTVAGALGLTLPAGRPAVDALAGALSDLSALLLLDNCEQVAESVSQLVDAVRARAEGVHVLVTSQKPLKAASEWVFRLGALALPLTTSLEAVAQSGAVELFVDRASAAEQRFELAAGNAEAVVEICRLLDGIPLALEMAAARIPLLGIDRLRDKLGQRFKLLIGGASTRPRRQQTLRAALEWSCALLSDDERAVLCRLGVFVGGWTLGLAQRVVSDERIDEWSVLDLLGQLVDKSLVVNDGASEPRYRLLETTRAYALELLELSGESLQWRRRHAEAMLEILEAADEARWDAQPAEDVTVFRELDNARAALDWSAADRGDRLLAIKLHAASMQLWLSAGLKAEGADRCAALAASLDDHVPDGIAARFWLTVAMMGLYSSRRECLEAAERAARLFRKLGDLPRTYDALIVCTGVAARRSDHGAASTALAEAQQLVDPAWPARRRSALAFAGWVSSLNARRESEAVGHGWREVALARESGSAFDQAVALGHVGIAEINVPGQEATGESRLREAVALFAAAGRSDASAHVSYSLSLALLRRGALDEALEQARQAYRLLRRDGEQSLMLGLLPLLAVRRDQFEAAARAAGYAAAVYARANLTPRGLFGEAVARLKEQLPAEQHARLMNEGAALNEEQAFTLVLGTAA